MKHAILIASRSANLQVFLPQVVCLSQYEEPLGICRQIGLHFVDLLHLSAHIPVSLLLVKMVQAFADSNTQKL